MKERTCCFTGHRKIPPLQSLQIAERLKTELIKLIDQGYLYFGAGGALGFDTIAAKTVLTLQQSCPQIKLILVLPCKTQTRGWEKENIKIYKDIKKRCNKVVYTSEDYTRDCMLKRNRHLVDNSSACICYLTESKGGTAYTVEYARRSGIKIVNLA
jgi:uncharacterized phage-like protein YoqJ